MTNSEIVKLCGDCAWSSTNGQDRGDGYDVDAYRLGGRFLVRAYDIRGGRSWWYVAGTLDAAKRVGAAGYAPGSAPGAYTFVRDPSRLKEIRTRVEG